MLHLLLIRTPPALDPDLSGGLVSCSSTPSTLRFCPQGPLPSPPAPQGLGHHTLALLLPLTGRPSSSRLHLLHALSPGSPVRMTHSHEHLACGFLPEGLRYMRDSPVSISSQAQGLFLIALLLSLQPPVPHHCLPAPL